MNRNFLLVALLVGVLPLSAAGQVAVSEDFEGYFPGPGGPTWLWWAGGGVDPGVVDNPDPFNPTFPTEISTDGLGEFQQAWKISFDTTNTTNWYWFGTNGGIGNFGPEFPAGGITEGGDDSGNWVFSVDVRAVGVLGDIALTGNFTFWDPDYEATFGVDWNDNGNMTDGANTYKLDFNLVDNDGDPDGFTSNSFRLNAGTPTTEVPGDIPRFGNDGGWVLNFGGGSGQYGFGPNSVTIDNVMIEFSAQPSVPGDYNGDGFVDAADYTVWRDNLNGDPAAFVAGSRDPSNVSPTINGDDYTYWKTNFSGGLGSGSLASSVVPEPSAIAFVLVAMLVMGGIRRSASVR